MIVNNKDSVKLLIVDLDKNDVTLITIVYITNISN
jgi:hypothetical protein